MIVCILRPHWSSARCSMPAIVSNNTSPKAIANMIRTRWKTRRKASQRNWTRPSSIWSKNTSRILRSCILSPTLSTTAPNTTASCPSLICLTRGSFKFYLVFFRACIFTNHRKKQHQICRVQTLINLRQEREIPRQWVSLLTAEKDELVVAKKDLGRKQVTSTTTTFFMYHGYRTDCSF